ncbi:MAG: VWA domain-containing protein [Hyphomicrobiaceae bacterium]|nr:MAG: VWA domain-containing protein [Hyphomicrobiaceae bacterium]
MADNRLFVHVLLDRSGSMESCRDATIAAFNNYLDQLKEAWKTPARLSLTTFDSDGIDLVVDAEPVASVSPLTRETFVPRASTPLFDAVGATVARLDEATLSTAERVALVILTDGQENASREHTRDSIAKLLAGRHKDKGWLIMYLGANQDAWAEGAKMGLSRAQTIDYTTENVGLVLKAAGRRTVAYMAAPSEAFADFTPEERAEAVKGKATKA